MLATKHQCDFVPYMLLVLLPFGIEHILQSLQGTLGKTKEFCLRYICKIFIDLLSLLIEYFLFYQVNSTISTTSNLLNNIILFLRGAMLYVQVLIHFM